MRSVIYPLFLSIVLLFSLSSHAQLKFEQSRIYNNSPATVFSAAAAACKQLAYPISTKDEASGVIITEPREVRRWYKKQTVRLILNIIKTGEYKTTVRLVVDYSDEDPYNFSGARSRTPKEILDTIQFLCGCDDFNAVLDERKNTGREKALLIFNFCSDEVKVWTFSVWINNKLFVQMQQFVAGELYELEVPEGTMQIDYRLESEKTYSEDKRYQIRHTGLFRANTINIAPKAGNVFVFSIKNTGKEYTGFWCGSCPPFFNIPVIWPYKYEEVYFAHQRVE